MPENWMEYWPYLAAILSAAIGITAAIHAAMTKDDVRAAIGWVGIILLSPFIGAFLYVVAGINRIRRVSIGNRRFRTERRRPRGAQHARVDEGQNLVPPEPRFLSLKHLGDRISPFPLSAGSRIEPLDGGDEAYPAMMEAIRGASRHVALSSYIFDNDAIGRQVADALIEASRRGVEVRVLIDAVGARYSRPPILGRLREGGVATERTLLTVT